MKRRQVVAAVIAVWLLIVPLTRVEALNVGGLIGAVVSSSLQRSAVLKQVKYYETDGREQLFAAYKDQLNAKDDPKQQILLTNIVDRLSLVIAQTDVSIIERPYNFFIVPAEGFNAACALGHTMFVNEGTFKFVNDNEDQLAAVVAHEFVHGQNEHNFKGMKKILSTLVLRNAIGSQLGGDEGGHLLLDIVTLNITNTGITKPHEWEADNQSYGYLTAAGYNPGAPAALWQRVCDTPDLNRGGSVVRTVMNPSTHPEPKERRDNFSRKLTEYSHNHVQVDSHSGEIMINGRYFTTPADIEGISGRERSYMIAGRLAALYHRQQPLAEVVVKDNQVFVGETLIMSSTTQDKSASELSVILSRIK